MQTKHLNFDQGLAQQASQPVPPHSQSYLAMYSTEWDAIVTDPRLMHVPVDDHLVHRGDGVFETLLWEGSQIYNLEAHLRRLVNSADCIGLSLPFPVDTLEQILADLSALIDSERFLIRVLLGRGTGGFGVDPAECPKASLYMIAYKAALPFMARYPEGAKVILSKIPPKSGGLANIKTCNYLPNVLMKAEAVAAGAHFALGLDPEGYLTESYTENFIAVRSDGTLIVPPADHHLPGTTLQRVVELARAEGITILNQKLKPEDLTDMSELLILGTTAYVTSIRTFEEKTYPIGPMAKKLSALLNADIQQPR